MLRYFLGNADTQTRFESSPEFKDIRYYLKKVRAQREALYKYKDYDSEYGRISNEKYDVFNRLINEIEQCIKEFNEQKPSDEEVELAKQKRIFLHKCFKVISSFGGKDLQTLLKRRNTTAESTLKVIGGVGMFGGIVAATGLTFTPLYCLAFFPSTYVGSLLGVYLFGAPLTTAAFGASFGTLGSVANGVSNNVELKFDTASNALLRNLTIAMGSALEVLGKGLTKDEIQAEVQEMFPDYKIVMNKDSSLKFKQ